MTRPIFWPVAAANSFRCTFHFSSLVHSKQQQDTHIVMSSSYSHQQTFAQRLAEKYQSAVAANNNLVDKVDRLVSSCDATSTPNIGRSLA
jgi:peptide subunit release factor RF-3